MTRPPKMPELIIDRPELQPRGQRVVYRTLTLIAWSLYLYLWLPLATLALWWLGLTFGFRVLRPSSEPSVDVALFALLLKAGLLAVLLMVGWAEYNRRRFQGNERRGPRPIVSPEQSAAAFGVEAEVARRLRGARLATLVLDEHARASDVQVQRPLDDPPTLRLG